MSLDTPSALANVVRRLSDLQGFQLDRLRSCTGSLDLHRELAAEMRTDMESLRRSLEHCRELAEDDVERDDYLAQVHHLETQFTQLRHDYRKALVSSKRAITAQARSRRHHLLQQQRASSSLAVNGDGGPSTLAQKAHASRSQVSEDDALQTKTNEVTDALLRTTTLMQAELERSVLSVQMLDESTRTLSMTQTLYDNYSNLLETSTHLVKAIERADWYDRLLILAAFSFFMACVAWVLKRRVLDRVVGGVGWWFGGSFKLLRMLAGGRAPVKDVASVGASVGAAGAASAAVHGGLLPDGSTASSATAEEMKVPIGQGVIPEDPDRAGESSTVASPRDEL